MRSIRPILFVSLGMLFSLGAAAKSGDKGDVLPLKATEKTLKNGLKVIVLPTGFANLVSLQIPVQTGSRNEVEPGKSGFAHFFEHMMFRGTKAYPPEAYRDILTEVGARQNAYTTDDYTNYHTTFAKEDLELMLKIEADRFMNLAYDVPAFKTESRAVLGEYNKNAAQPLSKLIEAQRDHAFTVHTYKHTTMGFLKDIEDMPNQYDYSKTFFDRWYRPENAALIVAGDVDPAAVLPLVEKYWGGWKPGNFKAQIPVEPPAKGPVYAHVPWTTPTPPLVSVAFHGPAFSDTRKDFAAVDLMVDLYFGESSDLYKKLVVDEQKVDQLFDYTPSTQDPGLVTIVARVKTPADAVYVRDQIMAAFYRAAEAPPSAERLAEARANARYGFARTLDNTETIAATLARFVRVSRSFDTLNKFYRLYDALTPADLQAAAKRYFTDANLVVTTLAKEALPEAIGRLPPLASLAKPAASAPAKVEMIAQKSKLPLLNVKFLFDAGSAHDPKGKEGLAYLSAQMIADAGSQERRIEEIQKALFPVAGSFRAQVDKEMTTFTAQVHRDAWRKISDLVLPMLVSPGLREDDFSRVKAKQLNALKNDLRNNNEEELAKERLQTDVFAGTPYGHPAIGTVAGIEAITLADVKDFIARAYTQPALTVGLAGDLPDALTETLKGELGKLPAQAALPALAPIAGKRPSGLQVEIIEKDTRSTAISLGLPMAVTRAHPDFAALWLARAWLGEHRSSTAHLYQRIREVRGMNYGDYAYVEAFPRGMFQFFPDPNLARRAQLFEIWIRPVMPANAHMALRIALYELDKLIQKGMSAEDFERSKKYLLKNVYVMTATQNQQLGYALDSKWYKTPEFTAHMRAALEKLTRDDVNRAVKQHWSAKDMQIVFVAKDAKELKQRLIDDAFSPIKYDAEKPAALLEEDKVIGAMKLKIAPNAVRVTPVDEVFAK